MAGPGAAEARSGQTRWGMGCSPNCSELWLPLPCSFCFSSFPLHLLPPCWVSSAFFIFLFFIFLFIFLPVLRCSGVSLSVPLLCPVHACPAGSPSAPAYQSGTAAANWQKDRSTTSLEHPPAILVQLLNMLVFHDDVSLTKYSLI